MKKGFVIESDKNNDYLYSAVPQSERRSIWKQVLVWIGFGYVATGLFIGGTFAGLGGNGGLPFDQVLLAITIGMGGIVFADLCFQEIEKKIILIIFQ